jgi:hypothetical protein
VLNLQKLVRVVNFTLRTWEGVRLAIIEENSI